MKVNLGLLASMILVIPCVFVGSSYSIEKDSIVGMWLFDEGQGDVAEDSSGNGHDGELLGDLEWVEGKFDGALFFPGADQNFVSIPHEDSMVLTTWSITAWLNTAAAGGWQVLASKGPDPYNYYLQIRDSGISNSGFTSAGAWQEAWGAANVQDGEWYHIAGTYDMNDLTVYVDGNLEKAETYGNEPDITTAPLGIGADSSGSWTSAMIIDEVAVFNTALSADQIKEVMTAGMAAIAAVSPSGKLATAWAQVKIRD